MKDLIALLRQMQEAMQSLQQAQAEQGEQILKLQTQLIAVRFLGAALAVTHPHPEKLVDAYMHLMDSAADELPPDQVQLFREDMNVVLRELLSLPRMPGAGTPPRSV